ncbi:MAG: glycosyltransferase [Clostridia bacterium]|nr:glycosyltransferase [Clostridia bacterium]
MSTPTIAILLATYDPREDWLVELLQSLNAQTYPSLKLYVRDDASPNYPLERLEALLKKHVTAFPFVLHRNANNLGSNGTFGALVEDCQEPYVAFCDQDDIWLPNKLENTLGLLLSSPLHPLLVCTNVRVMDGDGVEIAPRMEAHRRRHTFLRGTRLAPALIHRNFAMGCTMVMERRVALDCLPFPAAVVHDHYLAFCAATRGAIDYLEEPQMRYRVYGGNQTGVMAGITSKEAYYQRRIAVFEQRLQALTAVTNDLPALTAARAWADARVRNYRRERGGARALWKLRKTDLKTSLLELVVLRLPKPLFGLVVRMIQKGVL